MFSFHCFDYLIEKRKNNCFINFFKVIKTMTYKTSQTSTHPYQVREIQREKHISLSITNILQKESY